MSRTGPRSQTGEIDWLWARPGSRQDLVERDLAEAAVGWLTERGARAIFKMDDVHHPHRELWESLGFVGDTIRFSMYARGNRTTWGPSHGATLVSAPHPATMRSFFLRAVAAKPASGREAPMHEEKQPQVWEGSGYPPGHTPVLLSVCFDVFDDKKGGCAVRFKVPDDSALIAKHGGKGRALAACRDVLVHDLDVLIEEFRDEE